MIADIHTRKKNGLGRAILRVQLTTDGHKEYQSSSGNTVEVVS